MMNEQPLSQPSQSPPPSQPKRSLLVVGVCLFIVLATLTAYLFVQNQSLKQQLASLPTPTPLLSPTPQAKPDPAQRDTANWKTYELTKLGLQFRLPPIFDTKVFTEEEILGETGTLICGTFNKKLSLVKPAYAGSAWCNVNSFAIGTTSTDFAAGRSGSFMDLQGYEKSSRGYLAKFVDHRTFEIPSRFVVKEFTNSNDVTILAIRGANETTGEYRGAIAGTPGEGWVGALINMSNNGYSGAAVQLQLSSTLTQTTFDQILSTITFIK